MRGGGRNTLEDTLKNVLELNSEAWKKGKADALREWMKAFNGLAVDIYWALADFEENNANTRNIERVRNTIGWARGGGGPSDDKWLEGLDRFLRIFDASDPTHHKRATTRLAEVMFDYLRIAKRTTAPPSYSQPPTGEETLIWPALEAKNDRLPGGHPNAGATYPTLHMHLQMRPYDRNSGTDDYGDNDEASLEELEKELREGDFFHKHLNYERDLKAHIDDLKKKKDAEKKAAAKGT